MYVELQGKVYANDPHYDAFRGRVVQQSEVVGITLDGWKVCHRVTIVDFGKPDSPVADPDALIAANTDLDGNPRQTRTAHRRTLDLLNEIYALLHERPMNAREIAEATHQTVDRIKGVLRDHHGGLAVLSRGAWGNVYGLADRDYDAHYGVTLRRIVDYLREHGPTPAPLIYEALGMHRATLQKTVSAHPQVLRMVGTVPARGGQGQPAQVWDVAA